MQMGGPSRTGKDVLQLLDKFTSKNEKTNTVKLQIRHQKVYFEVEDDRLG